MARRNMARSLVMSIGAMQFLDTLRIRRCITTGSLLLMNIEQS